VTRIRESVTVDASPEDVWAVVADPGNLPRWNRHILEVHDVPENGLEPGSRYWTEMGGFGARFRVRAEVLEVRPPRYSRVRLTGPVEATIQTWVHPAGRNRSLLEHQVDYHVRGPLGSAIDALVRRIGATQLLRRGIRAQKRQVERG
jgi:carbon monoxide dehydrogenase subunit G